MPEKFIFITSFGIVDGVSVQNRTWWLGKYGFAQFKKYRYRHVLFTTSLRAVIIGVTTPMLNTAPTTNPHVEDKVSVARFYQNVFKIQSKAFDAIASYCRRFYSDMLYTVCHKNILLGSQIFMYLFTSKGWANSKLTLSLAMSIKTTAFSCINMDKRRFISVTERGDTRIAAGKVSFDIVPHTVTGCDLRILGTISYVVRCHALSCMYFNDFCLFVRISWFIWLFGLMFWYWSPMFIIIYKYIQILLCSRSFWRVCIESYGYISVCTFVFKICS